MKTLVATGCMPAANCAGELQVTCDGPEDCGGAGSECCMPSGALVQTACTTAGCLAGLAMCHTAADCQPGELCCASISYGYPTGLCQTGPCPQ